MKTFKSMGEVEAALLPQPIHGVVRRVMKTIVDAYWEAGETYRPEENGYVILVNRA